MLWSVGALKVAEGRSPGRRWLDLPRPRRITGVAPADTLLLRSTSLAATAWGITVFDAGDSRLKAFDWAGRPQWRAGRAGGGPGEFRLVTDLAGRGGEFWVLDEGNGRIGVYAANGARLRETTTSRPLLRMGLFPDGSLLGRSEFDAYPRLYAGAAREGQPLPPPAWLADAGPLEAESWLSEAGSRGVLLSFRWSSRLQLVDRQGREVWSVPGVDPVPFPRVADVKRSVNGRDIVVRRVAPDARTATIAAAVDGERVYVLRAGPERRLRGTVLDVYALADGSYCGSARLEVELQSLAAHGGRLALLAPEPSPHVLVMAAPTTTCPSSAPSRGRR